MRFVCVCVVALLAASCDQPVTTSPSSAVSSGENVALRTESFVGTVPLAGTVFYSFSVARTGPVSVTLLSLKEDGVDSSAQVSIGVGSPSGRQCLLSAGQVVNPAPTAQVTTTLDAGVHCAAVTDPGNLTAPGAFAVNITYPR